MKELIINKNDLIENVNKIKEYAERKGKDDNGNYTKIYLIIFIFPVSPSIFSNISRFFS